MTPTSRAGRVAGPLALAVAAMIALAACDSVVAVDDAAAPDRSPTGQRPSAASPAATATTAAPTATTGGSGRKAGAPARPAKPKATKPKATKPKATTPAPPPKLSLGDSGAAVVSLQRRLSELGYQVPEPDGEFGSETHHAVVAFQKVNHLDRDGVAGPRTMKALESPRRPAPRSRGGFHIEADLTLQVVYVVNKGAIERILDASSASGGQYVVDGDVRIAHTPEGSFDIERKINGWRRSDLGLLYRPAYFRGGYALHGAPSVPPFPASHGCIRITTTAMDKLYDRLALGTPMLVYRT